MLWKNPFDFFKLKELEPVTPSPYDYGIETPKLHIHDWVLKFSTYAPPRRDIPNWSIENPNLLQMLLMGLTTYAFECVICHMSKQESLLGSENMQLDDTLDKASEYGPQYVQRNGATFVIQRYQTPTQPVGLPIR